MALTEDRLRTADAHPRLDDLDLKRWMREGNDELDRSEVEAHDNAPAPSHVDLFTRWSHRLLAAWAMVLTPLMVLAPSADDPGARLSLPALLVTSGFTVGLVATLAGLGRGASWGFKASGFAAAFGVTAGIACAATGHHGGSWWAVESTAFGALLALTVVARGKASEGTRLEG